MRLSMPASRRTMIKATSAIALGQLGLAPTASAAEPWKDSKLPIRIVVPFPPGGYTDVVARLIANNLRPLLNRSVIVDNKAGANGILGTTEVARAAPDGNTLLLIGPGHITNALLRHKISYDPAKDFQPILKVGVFPNVLVVPNKSPYKNVKDLIAAAKVKAEGVSYASAGLGSSNHLSMELLQHYAGVKLRHIPYKGSGAAELDVMGGHIDSMFSGAPSAIPNAKQGSFRAIAVSGSQRLDTMPTVPTIAEAGVPDYQHVTWLGFYAPANTPGDVVSALNAAANKVMQTPELVQRMHDLGAENYRPHSAAEFRQFLVKETEEQTKLLSSAKVEKE
ncbi:Bug family tripartite tricarboxylate transporter substrate binding protein [Ottowia thiooxydans]|uniref:Tripartite-type tricarboxylate transporter receptor subunit TctC n=1 Tax=Ottowia thiooxydans TaxID=219182 RepID=A0ABV2Q993_9BURK